MMGSCKGDEIRPDSPYLFTKPTHFPEPTYTFDNNPVTEAGFKLGKILFNDPTLSSDNSVACSNCHAKAVAFADPQHRLSVGVDDLAGIRNAPPLMNLAFMDAFFWDGGVVHLDFVPINAIESDFEMNETLANVVGKLNDSKTYPSLFEKAFGEIDSINAPLMLHALSQYMCRLVSADSKYDQFLQQKTSLSQTEMEGLQLFEKKCSSCHSGVLFTNQEYMNNGLDTQFSDIGRERISEWSGDKGKFRVPSLRNVGLTAPYMHDGRFNTLEEVLQHYRFGIKASETLSPSLQKEGKLGIELTDNEQKQIIDFLHTLTDRNFTSNDLF